MSRKGVVTAESAAEAVKALARLYEERPEPPPAPKPEPPAPPVPKSHPVPQPRLQTARPPQQDRSPHAFLKSPERLDRIRMGLKAESLLRHHGLGRGGDETDSEGRLPALRTTRCRFPWRRRSTRSTSPWPRRSFSTRRSGS